MINKLKKIFNIKNGESSPLFWLFLHSFFMGIVTIFFESSASALFLVKFGVETMPYAYLGGAIIITVLGIIYSKLEMKFEPSKLFSLNLIFLLISIILLRISFYFTDVKWLILILFIWIEVIAILMSLEFWGLAGLIFNVRQGKRLFGLVGSGEVLAFIIGGFIVPKVVKMIGTYNLLYISIVSMFLCVLILIIIQKKFSDRLSDEDEEDNYDEISFKKMLKNRYLILLFVISSISVFAYYFADYAFYDQVEQKFPTEAEIASYLGLFFAVSGIINLIFKIFFAGKLLNKYGLKLGLTVLPVLLGIGSIAMITTNAVPSILIFFFWMVSLTKLFDDVFRNAVEEPSVLILFQPLPPASRLSAQSKIESIIEPVAGAVVSLILIGLGRLCELHAIHIAFIMVVIVVSWIVIAFLLNKEYPKMLEKALSKRRFGDDISFSLNDSSSLNILLNNLKSNISSEIIYSLNTLEKFEYEKLEDILLSMINHKDENIRLEVINKINKKHYINALKILMNNLELEKSFIVKEAMIKTICDLGETEILEDILPYLDSDNKYIKRGAMIGLLRNGGIEGVLAAGGILTDLIKSVEPEKRIFATEILGKAGIKSFYRPLIKLLNDPSEEVRKSAVIAAGELKNTKLWSRLIELLSDKIIKNQVSISLTKGGEEVLELLFNYFNKENANYIIQKKIIKIITKIQGEKAVKFLEKNIDYPDITLKYNIITSLEKCNYKAEKEQIDLIKNILIEVIKTITINYNALLEFEDSDKYKLLVNSIKNEILQKKNIIFSLLSFIYQRHTILKAKQNVFSELIEKKAYALEIIDSFISLELKSYIIPLFDDIQIKHKVQKLNNKFDFKLLNEVERIKYIIKNEKKEFSNWSKICALFIVGKLAYKEFYNIVVFALTDKRSVIRETAVWALGKINPNDLIERLQHLIKDKSAKVSFLAKYIIETVGMARFTVHKKYMTKTGECELSLFVNMLNDEKEKRARRCWAVNNIVSIGGDSAKKILVSMLKIEDEIILAEILKALIKLNVDVTGSIKTDLLNIIKAEYKDIKQTLFALIYFIDKDKYHSINWALKNEILKNKERIISVVSLLTSIEDYEKLNYWFINQDTQSDFIKKILKSKFQIITDSNIREKFSILFMENDFKNIIYKWGLKINNTEKDRIQILKELAFGKASWVRTWTRVNMIKNIIELDLKQFVPKIVESLKNVDDIVREICIWGLYKLDFKIYNKYKQEFKNDESPLIRKLVYNLEKNN